VTFNIHSGIGRNGLQLAQVAGEIAAVEPDVVLLQEVDQNRLRSRFVDEADHLATLLGMEHVLASNVERDGLRDLQLAVEMARGTDVEAKLDRRLAVPCAITALSRTGWIRSMMGCGLTLPCSMSPARACCRH